MYDVDLKKWVNKWIFRLGMFGFLSTETKDAPGNYGMLDQVQLSTLFSCQAIEIYRVVFLTGSARKVLSVGDDKIPNKKSESKGMSQKYVKF